MLDSLLELGRGLLPLLFTAALAILAVTLTSRLLATRATDMSRGGRQVIVLLVAGLGLIAVVLVLPIDGGTRNQLLGLLGLVATALVTVSSTTLASNALAGFMLRGTRRYRPGDFIRVDGHQGRVASQGLFQTEIQTEDSDIVIVPNMTLATNPVRVIRASGTIVSIETSLGYDAPRAAVKDALISAALAIELREPFVQLKDLGDFSVTYRIGGFLTEVKELPSVRSQLRAAVMDELHEAGIEIVSPTFMNQRQIDSDTPVVPAIDPFLQEPAAPHSAPAELAFAEAEAASKTEELHEQIAGVEESIERLKRERKDAAADVSESIDTELDGLGVRLTYLKGQAESRPPTR